MAFGLVFLDYAGDLWTVDSIERQAADAEKRRSLLFSRPSFLEPSEQRALEPIPDCWPNCTEDELRILLQSAARC